MSDDDPTPAAEEPAAEQSAVEKPAWWLRHYTFFGTVVALVFVWLSLTPSLLPRGPLFQAIVSGIAGAIGYAVGVFAVWLVRFLRSKDTSRVAPRWAWITLVVVGILGQIGATFYFRTWQDEVRHLMGVATLGFWDYPLTAVLGIVILFVLVEIGQWIGRFARFLIRKLNRICPPRVSAVVVVGVLAVVGVGLLNGVVVRFGMDTLNSTFAATNDTIEARTPVPTSGFRSGGPGSLVPWDSLGKEGRRFVDNATPVSDIAAFDGRGTSEVTEPIRAYAGLKSADSIAETASLAAAELERMGGLDRKIVAVGNATGTGWLNNAEASALEYMFGGDTAIVSMQYSYLPSWLSFLVDKENARQAGSALCEAVDALVRAMPEDRRPEIVVFGESLGSFGGEAPFLSLDNIVARTDGALFSGPTFNNTVWTALTADRDAGTPEWLPEYDDGQHVRFVADPANLGRPDASWDTPRVVYLQHASDPIAWWTPDLLFSEPDWLRESPGKDVSDDMGWIPIVTFLQVSADMAVATNVPDGHGHVYVRDVANAWAAILQPDGWTPDDTQRLGQILVDTGSS